MDLHSTLQAQALQLKNTPRTLLAVAEVVQKIMKTLYEVSHFPNAADRRPGRNPEGPNERFFVLLSITREHVFPERLPNWTRVDVLRRAAIKRPGNFCM